MKNTRASKIIFWTTTIIFSLMMVFSAYSYLTNDQMRQAFVHLGYPNYFRVELAIAKLIGTTVLLMPFPARLKEWAYAGFSITLISAFIAHVSSGDGPTRFMAPVVFGIILLGSYVSFRKLSSI